MLKLTFSIIIALLITSCSMPPDMANSSKPWNSPEPWERQQGLGTSNMTW